MFKKWILPIGSLLLLFAGVTCYFGVKAVADFGDQSTATYPVAPARLYAEIATPDSIAKWIGATTVIAPLGKGPMQVGDTIRLTSTPTPGVPPSRGLVSGWVVREAIPERLLVRDLYDSLHHKSPIAVRRDSFVAIGDSTRLITSFASSPFVDSAATKMRDSSPVMGRMAGGLFTMMRGFLTASANEEQRLLQLRLGGTLTSQQRAP